MKKISFVVMLAIVLVSLVSCIIESDVKAPVFENAIDNVLPEKNILVKTKTSEDDLIADVTATDDVDGKVVVVVTLGNFDYSVVGLSNKSCNLALLVICNIDVYVNINVRENCGILFVSFTEDKSCSG